MRLHGGADSVVVAAVLRCVIVGLVAGGAAAGAEGPPPPKPLQSPTPDNLARARTGGKWLRVLTHISALPAGD